MNKNNFCVSAAMLAMALSLSACTTMNDDMMATSASAGETVMVGDTDKNAVAPLFGDVVRYELLCRTHYRKRQTSAD